MDFKTIILAIVVILFLYFVIRYMTVPSSLSGLESGKDAIRVSKDSLDSDESSPSSNFTYSIWFNIDTWNYRYGQPKILFGRLDSDREPCPSVVLGAMQNDLTISMSCYPSAENDQSASSEIHKCRVQNIPIQKWTHLLMSVYGKALDVYIDGKLVKTCVLPGLAKIDKSSDVFITPVGGFSGSTAKFQYWDSASNPQQAWNIYRAGWSDGLSIFDKYKVIVSFYEDNELEAEVTI
jgi:hypothetical protein